MYKILKSLDILNLNLLLRPIEKLVIKVATFSFWVYFPGQGSYFLPTRIEKHYFTTLAFLLVKYFFFIKETHIFLFPCLYVTERFGIIYTYMFVRGCIKSANLLRCLRTQCLRLVLLELVPAFSIDTCAGIHRYQTKIGVSIQNQACDAVILASDIWFSNTFVNWQI